MASIDEVLKSRFGLESFRPWQREAIEAVMGSPGRALVVAPTGGGKSLTYQLPAAMLEGVTLVLSPLVALMEDQVRGLTARGVEATYLASTLDMQDRSIREANLLRGKYRIVYVAPERLGSESFVRLLQKIDIGLVAIDEAHCIAQWGHDFRPDYLRIGSLLEQLQPKRVLACTATATPAVRDEIVQQLGFAKGSYTEVLRGFARPNLHLAAKSVDGPKEARSEVDAALGAALGTPRMPKGGAIIYAATRKTTEQVAETLSKKGWNAAHYHAGMSGDARSKVAERFAKRKLDVVVATNAFGMGIDRPDIRTVIHFQPPASIEAYYQEVGRAGRDGDEASGLLLCSGADIALRRRLVTSGTEGSEVDPVLAARAWGQFRELLRYLDARSCRHDFVLRYFGDENELLGGCGHCDVCLELDGETQSEEAISEETVLIVKKALSAVARAQKRAGLGAVADMLAGLDNDRINRFGFNQLSTFGLLKDRSPAWILALLRAFVAAGWVDLTTSDHPVPYITRAGVAVMKGEAPARIGLPSEPKNKKKKAAGSSSSSKKEVVLPDHDRPLFEMLRAHRAEIARDRKVPPYVVAHDRTLVDMARMRPQNSGELLAVHGMGPSRAEQYGEGFLRVIQSAP